MDSPWKRPTKDQLIELHTGAVSTWITVNGINGRKCINKTDTSKYIFLPAAGMWEGSNYSRSESTGYYWLTVLDTPGKTSGAAFVVDSGNIGTSRPKRWNGNSVRAI